MSRFAPLALALALAAPPVTASATDEVYTVIREQGAAANTAFSQGDFATAAQLYEAVEKLLQTVEGRDKELAIVRFNLGRCYDELGQKVDALEAYRRSLTGPLAAQLADPIRERVRELESAALGRILVLCDVQGATVALVGGDEQAGCNHTFTGVAPGPHVILARSPDGREQRAPAEVVKGATVEVRVLTPEPEGPVNVLAWSLTGGAALSFAGWLGLYLGAEAAVEDGVRFGNLATRDDGTFDQKFLDAQKESYDQAETLATASYVALGLGVALAAGATWAWLADDGDPSLAVTPWIGPDGLGIVGRF